MNLQELGFTKEELQQRVVDGIVEQMLTSIDSDEGGNETRTASSLKGKLNAIIKARVDERVQAIADEHILPYVGEMIHDFQITETNSWGEPKAKSMTLTEYLVARAEKYMVEEVDYNGKDKTQESYNWRGCQTRISHAINAHLHYNIETAMKEAIKNANSVIAKGIHETCRLKLNEIAASLQVTVTTTK